MGGGGGVINNANWLQYYIDQGSGGIETSLMRMYLYKHTSTTWAFLIFSSLKLHWHCSPSHGINTCMEYTQFP